MFSSAHHPPNPFLGHSYFLTLLECSWTQGLHMLSGGPRVPETAEIFVKMNQIKAGIFQCPCEKRE